MHAATLTEKFQIGIPKAFRDDLGLKAGQQFVFVAKGDTIIMIPRRSISEMRGLLKGANTDNVRDRADRN
jgi:AbrB family looped-hinge helix DNA binding protein